MAVEQFAEVEPGRELDSASAVADSKQTLLCTCLSGVLLLNSLFGWSWADRPHHRRVAVHEGREAWHGQHRR